MAEAPYRQYRNYQFAGPLHSEDYNEDIEATYKDLVVLYNLLNYNSELVGSGFKMSVKDLLGLTNKIAALDSRLRELESNLVSGYISFKGASYTIDNDLFIGTGYETAEVDRLSSNSNYPGVFLPPAGSTSAFQSGVVLNGDVVFVPDSVETLVTGVPGSADTVGSVIDTTQPELSFGRNRGPNWERNVITSSIDADGAQMVLYVKVPSDVSPNSKCNYVALQPYPAYTVDIIDVSVSTKAEVILDDTDNYVALNKNALYADDPFSVGVSPPGGWDEDTDLMAGNRLWIFDPREVTALRIKFRQRNYFTENENYVYTYGANSLDIGYLKTLDSGKMIVRYDAADEHTISSIDEVVPSIFNVAQAYLPDVFSYKVIWETAYNSGVFTEDPVAFSKRVWFEITLNRAADGTIPLLSGIAIAAS